MFLISVIVPSYNHAPFLAQRLASILEQTYTNFELIILDDASTDNSREIIESFRSDKRVSHIIFNTKNSRSAFGQWKQGVELARGEWIWIAESDDFAADNFLEECVDQINKYPQAGICYCDSFIWVEAEQRVTETYAARKNRIYGTNKWSSSYYRLGADEINENLKYDCTINNISSMVFNKALAVEVLPRLSAFGYYGDWYFCLRLALLSNICYIAKSLNTYRKHPGSHLNSPTSLLQSRKEYFLIFKLLYHEKAVLDKKGLLNSFTYNHLSFGILEDGPKNIFMILKSYFMEDWKLSVKVLTKIVFIKLLHQRFRAKYDLIERAKKDDIQ